MPRSSTLSVAAVALAAVPVIAGCVSNTPAQGSGPITVTSTATECRLSASTASSGTVTFKVTNAGEDATEFYLLAEDGVKVVGEVENIGPGISRDLVVQARPGSYVTACKPGMTGDGIRAPFTVTDSGASIDPSAGTTGEQLEEAEDGYLDDVRDEVADRFG
jgi:iron uptake system component EfeO